MMQKFIDFLIEEAEAKHATIAYGRMNPPTTGHLKVVNKVQEVAKKQRNIKVKLVTYQLISTKP